MKNEPMVIDRESYTFAYVIITMEGLKDKGLVEGDLMVGRPEVLRAVITIGQELFGEPTKEELLEAVTALREALEA